MNSDIVQRLSDLYWRFGDPVARWCGENLPLLVAAAIVLVVFWEIPFLILRSQVKFGISGAFHALPRVRLWGLPAYIMFLVQRRRSDGGPLARNPHARTVLPVRVTQMARQLDPARWLRSLLGKPRDHAEQAAADAALCPHCYKTAGQRSDYGTDPDFSLCPHCGERISPRLYFGAHVRQLVAALAATAERAGGRRRSGASVADSESMAALLKTVFGMACALRATDIHLERKDSGAVVQMRIDGMLSEAFRVPASLAPHVLSALKVQAKLDITNHTSPQDGRFSAHVSKTDLDVRVHGAPTSDEGEILFLRLLDKRSIQLNPSEIGLENDGLRHFQEAIRRPHGLILVTGPTGSGKSTTLYVALREIATGERNILTVEDPVEYHLPGLKQMQVNPAKNFGFANGLRSVLRQDPDVIMVGEIRDRETAIMATEAAGTGHLVFSTLHTMDAATAPARLADLGVTPSRYAPALELVLAQRLVRLICPECREPYRPTSDQLDKLGLDVSEDNRVWRTNEAQPPLNYANAEFFAGAGCPACENKGYLGRTGIFETLHPDAEFRRVLETETSASGILDVARSRGFRSLRDEALRCAHAGRTTLEEVLRVTT